MSNIKEKSKQLIELRAKIAKIDEEHNKTTEPLKVERDTLQQEIMNELKEQGQYSARFDFATVTRAVRRSLQVIDESAVISYLKKKKLDNEYVAPQLNSLFHNSFAKQALKEGLEIPGMQTKETEYISISAAKEGTEKRKISQ